MAEQEDVDLQNQEQQSTRPKSLDVNASSIETANIGSQITAVDSRDQLHFHGPCNVWYDGEHQPGGSTPVKDYIDLPGSIRLYHGHRLGDQENLFHGERISQLLGKTPLAIATLPNNAENIEKVKSLVELSHPNLARIIHADEYQEGAMRRIFIAMDNVKGTTLYEHVRNRARNTVSEHELISQAKQLIDGLRYMHGKDVVHGNISPVNIFVLQQQGQVIFVYTYTTRLQESATRYRNGSKTPFDAKPGTRGYMASEVIDGGPISKEADIFSLGLVFHFLWSNGSHPYGNDPDCWDVNIKWEQNRTFDQLIINRADRLLKQMLHTDPLQRPKAESILCHEPFGIHISQSEPAFQTGDRGAISFKADDQENTLMRRPPGQTRRESALQRYTYPYPGQHLFVQLCREIRDLFKKSPADDTQD